MAKGYPAPRPPSDPPPAVVPEGTCAICKKRPAEPGTQRCATCAEALRRG